MEAAPHPWPALGVLLMRDELVSREALEGILDEQRDVQKHRISGTKLGEILIERGIVAAGQIARLLAEQYELPYVELDIADIDLRVARCLSVDQARRFSAVPVSRAADGSVLVAIADPSTVVFSDQLRRDLDANPRFEVTGPELVAEAIAFVYSTSADIHPAVELDTAPGDLGTPGDDALATAGSDSESWNGSQRAVARLWPPLGALLVRDGLVGEDELERALAQQRLSTSWRLGEILVNRGLVPESEIARLVAEQYELSFVELVAAEVDPEIARRLPFELARDYLAAPIAARQDGSLHVAIADPTVAFNSDELHQALGAPLTFVVAAPDAIQTLIDLAHSHDPAPDPVEAEHEHASAETHEAELVVLDTEPVVGRAPDEELVAVLDGAASAELGEAPHEEIASTPVADSRVLVDLTVTPDEVEPAAALDEVEQFEPDAPLEHSSEAPSPPFMAPALADLVRRDESPADGLDQPLRDDEPAAVLDDPPIFESDAPPEDSSPASPALDAGPASGDLVPRDEAPADPLDEASSDVAPEPVGEPEPVSLRGPAVAIEDDGAPQMETGDLASEPVPSTPAARQALDRLLTRGATSVHLSPRADGYSVRVRLDGIIRVAGVVGRSELEPLVESLEADRGMRRHTIATAHGDKVTLFPVGQSPAFARLSELGLDGPAASQLERSLARGSGLVVFSGPADSGVSTSLRAALATVADERIAGAVTTRMATSLTGVDHIDASDPTVTSVGEAVSALVAAETEALLVEDVHDATTAALAFEAGMSGRLVLCGLRVMSATAAMRRLSDLGVSPTVLSDVLTCVVTQRLVRRVCESCRETYYAAEPELDELGVPAESNGPRLLARGRGCETCDDTGYRGRVGVFEVLPLTHDTRALVLGQASTKKLARAAAKTGLSTLRQDAVRLCLEGVTTTAEVERVLGARTA